VSSKVFGKDKSVSDVTLGMGGNMGGAFTELDDWGRASERELEASSLSLRAAASHDGGGSGRGEVGFDGARR